ncbi:phage T7 F exclusion suppressor FxsA [Corynebacterium occultum]|uniref:Phage T7 F exclusion suppressor FxsA n=1 Tax=Corynebacterium occultum TaxID=2675219 RepID=A0A6B8W5X7_9CORY|nr:FxsA family protein [Corynebacterium occultum]QGU07377.1 phage T7 F exclusion suppressor FxsA [Corynebacterium occultum]
MPLLIALPYFILEILTFWALASWLGLGWAILAIIVAFFGGLWLAAAQMRSISQAAATQKIDPGQAAGDTGLLAAGAVLVALPGIATTLLGLLLIIPPTRMVIRKILARKLRTSIENLGVRSFEATNMYRERASYGNFRDPNTQASQAGHPSQGQPNHEVIDEAEIQEWTSNLDPEDFLRDEGDSGKGKPEK